MPFANISDEAEEDLAEIWAYIALDNSRAADKFIEKLRRTCQILSEFPGMGPMRPELAKDLRSFPVGRYIIFYRRSEQGIDVARVIHGMRNIKRVLGKRR